MEAAEIEVEVAGAADATAGSFYLGQIIKKGEDRSGLPPFFILLKRIVSILAPNLKPLNSEEANSC